MKKLPTTAAAFILVMAVGCGDESISSVNEALDDSTLQFERARLVLTSEPGGSLTPTEAIELAEKPAELVLAGRIDAGDIDPFQPGKASFMLSQLPEEGHGDDDPDHADNCPFCKRELEKAPKAIVQFKDESGVLLNIDAKELFNIEKGDAVVVTGELHYQKATHTVNVDASGIFRRGS